MLITTEPLAVTDQQHLLALLAQPPFETNRCWEWTRSKLPSGYALTYHAGKSVYTHRLAYTLAHGEIPAGLVVHHICYRRACCNPAHLEARTHLENIFDEHSKCPTAPHNRHNQQHWGKIRGRKRVTICPRCGSTDRGTIRKSEGKSQTYCRACNRTAKREWLSRNPNYVREYKRRLNGYYERRGLTPPPHEKRGRQTNNHGSADASLHETNRYTSSR